MSKDERETTNHKKSRRLTEVEVVSDEELETKRLCVSKKLHLTAPVVAPDGDKSDEEDGACHAHEEKEEVRGRRFGHEELPLEWWERDEECREAKAAHTLRIDTLFDGDRENVIFMTTLKDCETTIEDNMFPYSVPSCIKHLTLWSRNELSHHEIVDWVDEFLNKHYPRCKRWQYDDNLGYNSICIFHVHVFVEIEPYSLLPRPGHEYFPPHMKC